MDNKKLFIGSLPWSVTSDDLAEAFAEAGTVEDSYVATERETGRSRGFGFVTMSSEEEAQAAIELWNEKEYKGRTIFVNIAKPKEPRPQGGGFSRY